MKSLSGYGQLLLGAAIITLPLVASAQTVTDVPSLFTYALNILNGYVVPIIFAIAFVFFLFNVYRYFIQNGGNAEKVQEGQKFVLWSVIGFVIMFSIWGIINLFINTLGFDSSAQPAFPTFNGGTSGSLIGGSGSNSIACFFGGCSNSSNSNGSSTASPAVGSTFTAPDGTVYTYTAPNTLAQVNGSCPSGWSPSGTNCIPSAGFSTGNGTVPAGGRCSSNADCSGGNECDVTGSGTCKADNGLGQAGDQCTTNDDCNGGLVCNENSDPHVCADPNAAGVSEVGEGSGTVQQGGSCQSSADCADNLECNTNTETCQPDNGLGQAGDSCSSNSDCDGNLVCDANSNTCADPDAAGVQEMNDTSSGNDSGSGTGSGASNSYYTGSTPTDDAGYNSGS